MNQRASRQSDFDWLHFVTRSGACGKRWTEWYSEAQPLEALATEVLRLLRSGRYDEGYGLLERMRRDVDAAHFAEHSIRSVVERWYYGVLGYYFYCLNQPEPAHQAMVQAHQAVTAAVGAARFLLPLANHCHEFRLHRARISRNALRWDEMRAHVEEVRAMMQGTAPFCVLEDGRTVGIRDIQAFYTAVPSLTSAERQSLAGLLDDTVRLRNFDQFVSGMYRIPGFVIPFA